MAPGRRHVRAGREGAGAQARHACSRVRAAKLYELYRAHAVARGDPAPTLRARLEKRRSCAPPFDEVWAETQALLASARSRARSRAPSATRSTDGAGVPLVPRHVEPLGDRRRRRRGAPTTRSGAARRWARSTRWVDGLASSPSPANRARGADRAEPARRRRRRHARASSSARYGVPGAGRGVRLPPAPARLTTTPALQTSRCSTWHRSPRSPPSPSSASARCSPARPTPPASGATSSRAATSITDVPPSALADRGLLRPRPAAPDKTYAKRGAFLSPRRLRPAGVRHPAEHRAGDRHRAAAGADRRAAGARRRERGPVRDDRPRAHQRASSASPRRRSCSARW